jgi:Cytochrome c553
MEMKDGTRRRRTAAATAAAVAGFCAPVVIAALAGCDRAGGGADTAALIEKGKAVYAANNCGNCHVLGDQGGGKAPNLTHAGAQAGHNAAWFAEFVKDPKKVKPGARMPSYAGKISDDDLKALGEYLASLK